jgi:hypothetical protein
MTLHTYYQCNGPGCMRRSRLVTAGILPFGWVELEKGKHWCFECAMKWNQEVKEIEKGIGDDKPTVIG